MSILGGAGALVLEEYERAVARGAKIYCEMTGYGNSCDAYHVTAPHPEAEGSIRMIELAMEEAGAKIDDCFYINLHGTSTPLNDKAESFALRSVLGEQAYRIPMSSTKSMVGHMLGAAGAVEAIASIKALETEILPPTIGLKVPDPDCDLDYILHTARPQRVDKALSLSLGFGGHNAGVLFQRIGDS
jgi:3-oxoacyl-[acyl-carrier-protein] synthase II